MAIVLVLFSGSFATDPFSELSEVLAESKNFYSLQARFDLLVIAPTEAGTHKPPRRRLFSSLVVLRREQENTRQAQNLLLFLVFVRHWVIVACSELNTKDVFFRAPFAFKDSVIERFCNWYHLSHFAAFFNEIGSQSMKTISSESRITQIGDHTQDIILSTAQLCCPSQRIT
jgi:hypothetical protein